MKMDGLLARLGRSPTLLKTPVRLQGNPVDCAAACLGIVLEYYGHSHSIHDLRRVCAVGQGGATVAQIQRGVASLGHHCRIVKKGIGSLGKSRKPVILHWDLRHFVVLEGVRGNRVWVNDPAMGRRSMTRADFERHFTGVCLEIEIDDRPGSGCADDGHSWRQLQALAPEGSAILRGAVLAGGAASLLLVGTEMIFAGVLRAFFDYVVEFQMSHWGYVLALCGLPLIGARFALRHAGSLHLNRMSSDISIRIRQSFLERFYRHPTDFFEMHFAGELFGRLRDLDECLRFQLQSLQALGRQTLVVGVISLVLFITAPVIGLVHLGPRMAMMAWLIAVGYRSREQELRTRDEMARYQAIQRQRAESYPRFFAAGLQRHLLATCLPMLGKRQAAMAEHHRRFVWRTISKNALNAVVLPLSAFAGAYLMIDGQLSYGGYVFATVLAIMLSSHLDEIVETVMRYSALKPVVRRVVEVIDETMPEDRDWGADAMSGDGQRPGNPDWLIEVREVRFGYNGVVANLFERLNLHVTRGEVVNIAGPSGAGKTTLLDLLAGLRQPLEGAIFFKGKKLTGLAPVGIVFADDDFMTGSLADFIANGEEADRERLAHVLHLTDLWGRLGFFAGLDGKERLETQGLSRGEVQRLMLAQALYRSEECLFFDEAFNHLSLAQSERILANLRSRGVTMVMATHRPEIQALCDRVIRLV